MVERLPTKVEILEIVDAQTSTVDELSKRLVRIEQLVEKQEDRNSNIIYAVLMAAVLVVVAVAVEVIISDRADLRRSDSFLERVYTVERDGEKIDMELEKSWEEIRALKEDLDSLRVNNRYLK